jgi:phage-related protein
VYAFYYDGDGNKPVLTFLEDVRKQDRILHKLVAAGIKKLETSERHGPPLTQLIDQKDALFELRIGDKNIARVFFFFQQGQQIILTNGYVKKQQKVDTRELERARTYKKDWEKRQV